MSQPLKIAKNRRRFYDGGHPGDAGGVGVQPADPDKDVLVILDRQLGPDRKGRLRKEMFVLRRRIAYDDRHRGEIIVPPVFAEFRTDLTSVPALFTWLVPKTGAHLPAALLHDGLVWDPRKEAQTYISSRGLMIDRVEADRIFRDGMADTGTALVRRWLVWTAVTLATMWSQQATAASRLGRSYYRWVMAATMFSVAWLGYVATADLFDQTDSWPLTYELTWMGDRPFWTEVVTGLAGAIVVPLVLGALWGKFRGAGWIAGIGVAVLFHVTVGLLVMTGLYLVLEWLAARLSARWLLVLAAALAAGAAVVFVLSLL
jgi:hypothetical protein